MLKINNLDFSYNKVNIIKDISFHVKEGEFVGLVGGNGSGKTTILKNIYRGLIPNNGSILLDGKDLLKMSYKNSAKKMAVVVQENELHFDFNVEEMVAMGRSPYKKIFDIDDEKDKAIIFNALRQLGIESLAKKSYLKLSGGEKQRVIIARAIAQEAKVLILDEPTNHLDINYQLQIFEILQGLNVTVLAAIHDLNLASLFCDRLIVLKEGRIVLQGTPDEVLTDKNIFDIFGVNTFVEKNKVTGKNSITYLPKTVKVD